MDHDIKELQAILFKEYELEISTELLQRIVDYFAEFIAELIRLDNDGV